MPLKQPFSPNWLAFPCEGGYTTDGRGFLLTHKVEKAPDIVVKHQVFYYQRILRGLGIQTSSDDLELFIPGFEIDQAKAILHEKIGRPASTSCLLALTPGQPLARLKMACSSLRGAGSSFGQTF